MQYGSPARMVGGGSPWAEAPSVPRSATAWREAQRLPASLVNPRAQGRLFTIMFLTVGLVEAMYFINLAFTALFIFSLYKK